MKVCLLNESFPPVIDGVVNVMMNYADYMMRDYGAEIVCARVSNRRALPKKATMPPSSASSVMRR